MRKRKPRYRRIFFVALLLVFATLSTYMLGKQFVWLVQDKMHAWNTRIHSQTKDLRKPIDISDMELRSPYAILIDLDKQDILLDRKSEETIYPASLTKIMTAIVAIEHLPDLQQSILLPANMFPDLYAANASRAGFLPGEKVTALDLLYGTMLPSGADASIGLARYISGSEHEFVQLMNKKASQLGMKDTHFTNATGLHHSDHYTTVKDIAVLLQYALQNETFHEIFTTSRHSTSPTNLHPDGITFTSTLFAHMDTSVFEGGEIMGGKTGYTQEAGLCLATLANKNGRMYMLVTAGAAGNHLTEQNHILDAFTVYQASI